MKIPDESFAIRTWRRGADGIREWKQGWV